MPVWPGLRSSLSPHNRPCCCGLAWLRNVGLAAPRTAGLAWLRNFGLASLRNFGLAWQRCILLFGPVAFRLGTGARRACLARAPLSCFARQSETLARRVRSCLLAIYAKRSCLKE